MTHNLIEMNVLWRTRRLFSSAASRPGFARSAAPC
jgi:hypothetical protein